MPFSLLPEQEVLQSKKINSSAVNKYIFKKSFYFLLSVSCMSIYINIILKSPDTSTGTAVLCHRFYY